MLSLANEAAATGVANFATEPESIAEWEDAFTRSNERFPWLVAERDGGGVAGFAKASPYRTRGAYLWTAEVTVYVEPSRHRRGVGFALYRELIDTLVAQGFVTLVACITRGQEASERLHERSGFVRSGWLHRAGYKFGAWHDIGLWERGAASRSAGAAPAPPKRVRDVRVR
ncbi:MAG: N-acetyltransferase [Myxococcales bacterium]|nr:N-acetyltransferase [Myxococcales bacterium]